MRDRPIIMIDTTNGPTFCRNHCSNGNCSKHISKGMAYMGPCQLALLKDKEGCEGYISRRQQKNKKCELCGESCREQTMIKNKINGKELKICNACLGKYQFKQETGGCKNEK